MEIRTLHPKDAASFQHLRLNALRECPTAFSSSYEEECDIPLSRVGERLSPTPDRAVFGAFDDGSLIGIVGLRRESHRKLSHKAFVWGVYVAPTHRQRGIGRRLLQATLDHAGSMPGLRQVTLSSNAANVAANALYKALGFEPFGVEKDFLVVDGVFYDEIHMARVRPAFVAPGTWEIIRMRTQGMLFTATALIEAGGGLSLVSLPALAIWILLGVREPSPEALVVSRVCGAALLAIGIACWLARDDRGSRSQHGLLWAMLVYNVGACIVLAFAGSMLSMAGVGLWPGVGLHAIMTIWCALNLRASPTNAR